jgi:hypothetical protein
MPFHRARFWQQNVSPLFFCLYKVKKADLLIVKHYRLLSLIVVMLVATALFEIPIDSHHTLIIQLHTCAYLC